MLHRVQNAPSVTHRRPRHASSETDMPLRRLTCPIRDRHAGSETDMPDRKTTRLIGEWHSPSETSMPVETHLTHLNILIFMLFLLIYICMYVHVGIRWVVDQSFQSPMWHVAFRWLSDEACRGLRRVSNQACRGLRSGMSRSPIRHVQVSDQACRSPKGSPIFLRWVTYISPMGLRYVSDTYPIGLR